MTCSSIIFPPYLASDIVGSNLRPHLTDGQDAQGAATTCPPGLELSLPVHEPKNGLLGHLPSLLGTGLLGHLHLLILLQIRRMDYLDTYYPSWGLDCLATDISSICFRQARLATQGQTARGKTPKMTCLTEIQTSAGPPMSVSQTNPSF